jgi:TonB-dependent receptor
MLNTSAMLGGTSRISFNNTYTRTADNEARQSEGPSFSFSGIDIQRNTLRFIERSIRSSQLKGEHTIGSRQALDWAVSSSGVSRKEPDRSDLVYAQFAPGLPFVWTDGNPDVARRTFGDLRENNWVYAANYRLAFSDQPDAIALKVGATARRTTRDAVNRQFSIVSSAIPAADQARRAEELFDGRFTQGDQSQFRVINVSEDGIYDASERLAAGYLMAEIPVGTRVRLIGGARLENATITVNTSLSNSTRFRSALDNTDILPAAVANVKLGDNAQLRASASRTLARPEYRELSPVQYLEVVGGQITRGNGDLVRTLIENYDVKYERFPNPGEVLSIGVFAKRFDRPIERIDIATGGAPIVSFFNADAARNLGVELEARKGLGGLAERLEAFSVFSNVTLMRSTIDVGSGASANTNAKRAMMGQAPWVVNAGGTWSSRTGRSSATLLYSAVGPRIYSAGTIPFPDVKEQTRHLLDLSLRVPVTAGMDVKVDARNLLDAPFRLTQGPVTREEYRLGRQLSIGAQWRR